LQNLSPQIKADIAAINRIDAVPSILEVICRTTGMGFAAVARVTDDRWIVCAVRDEIQFGLVPGGELKLETTICNEIRQHHNAVVIDHVAEDKDFCGHHTPAMYGFQSYISMPIMLKNGDFFGTLCAIDPKPAHLNNPHIRGMFGLFAEMLAMHLHNLEQLDITASTLLEERKTAELREQFIAILGHDLRNPVTAITNIAQLMQRMPLDERMQRLAAILKDSSYRMKTLIENILDFARGRLGDGIIIGRKEDVPLADILNQTIAELSIIWPEQIIETQFTLTGPVNCDSERMAQLISNLLGNAFTHGKKDQPVIIKATSDKNEFVLTICNSGEKISDKAMKHLFHPFYRGAIQAGQQGLGLGLYIVSEIARAHGGTISVESSDEQTCFTFRMPVNID